MPLKRCTLILIGITLAAYLNGVHGPFLWDDLETVVGNTLIQDTRNIPAIFKTSVFGQSAGGNEFYRPMVTLSFLINYRLVELQPLLYHLTNLALHLASTLLTFNILRRLKYSNDVALFVAAVFAVHPIGIEVVTFVSGRSDALASTFILLSLYSYLRVHEHAKWIMSTLICFAVALLSKESAVILPVLFIALVWAFPDLRSNKRSMMNGFLLTVALLYAASRLWGISDNGTASLSWIASASMTERLMTVPYALLMYLKILVWPHPLHMEYHTVITSLLHPTVWLGIPLLLGLMVMALRTLPKRTTLFWLVWIVLGLLPVLNIIAPQTSTLREHWMYLPSIGFYALIASLPFWKKFNSENLLIASIALMTALGVLTYERNRDWLDPMRLYAHDLSHEPRSFTLWNNIGTEYFNQGEMQLAKEAFVNAIENSPRRSYSIAYNNLGVIVQQEGNLEEAVTLYSESVRLTGYELAYGNLAEILWSLGRYEEAQQVIAEGVQVHPYSADLRNIQQQLQ